MLYRHQAGAGPTSSNSVQNRLSTSTQLEWYSPQSSILTNWVHPAESPISKAGYTEQLLVKEIAKKPTIGWPAAFNANVFT